VIDRGFEEALLHLNRRGYPVRRVRQELAPPGFRDRMVRDALAAGFGEFLWLDPAVCFDPSDVPRLRAHNLPFVCGIYPASGKRGLNCEFPPGTTRVRFGPGGGLQPLVSSGLGFALIRRETFEALAKTSPPGAEPTYFAIPAAESNPATQAAEDVGFCHRVRECGIELVADMRIRLWRFGSTRLSWEDAGCDRDRFDEYTLRILPAEPTANTAPGASTHPEPRGNLLRGPATPLAPSFPRIGLFVVTYQANAASLAATLASIRESDWGEEPVVVMQPEDWPVSRESGSRNFKRAFQAAVDGKYDFALVLEDDVRVGQHLRHNVFANPLVKRDQCDYLGLFIPDLIADPWQRQELHLGYRLAKPRYAGPNALWERNRIWGSQGCLLSRRLLIAALERWDRLVEGQDTRILSVCAEFQLPLWYTAPCLVEHAPVRSAFGTPDAYAPDFDAEFRLESGQGFQPPEDVPGWLTLPEAELLWRTSRDRTVLELGTACGRSTVCLAQSAERVVSVDLTDQSEAREWVRRYGLPERVEFHQGDAADVCRTLKGEFDVIVIDTLHDAATVTRDIAVALPRLTPGGLLAFHDYPDPAWPDLRRVVDEHAQRLGWKRVTQTDFLGVFRV
jgi:hypothetical protein